MSIRNKKIKYLLLATAFLSIAVLIFTGLSIQTAEDSALKQFRCALGEKITLQSTKAMTHGVLVPIKEADKLLRLKHLEKYNYIVGLVAHGINYKAIGAQANALWSDPDTYLIGTVDSSLYKDFTGGNAKIIQGRHLTKNDVHKPYAIIEKELAKVNNIRIGDTLTFGSVNKKGKNISLTIIGIYEANDDAKDTLALNAFSLSQNKILTSYTNVEKIADESGINFAEYILDDPIHIDQFRKNAVKLFGRNSSAYQLDAQDELYNQLTNSIRNLAGLSRYIVAIVIFASSIILSLVVMLSLKSRFYEIGVLLAIGESKLKIISQLVVETFIPVCISFALAIFISSLVSQQITDHLISLENNQQDQRNINVSSGVMVQGDHLQQSNKLKVKTGTSEILELLGIGMTITLISSIIPIVSVLRYNPKKILLIE